MKYGSLTEIPYQDKEFWRSLCPDLTLSENEPIACKSNRIIDSNIHGDEWNQCKQLICEDGYFAYESFFTTGFVQRLASCLAHLDESGIPPVLCFVYDEFWEVLLQLDTLLSDLLGPYTLLPAVWAWIVKPTDQTAFTPHRDLTRPTSVDNENHLDYLTLWIPLTDLNHLSSSIFLVPASLDPDYDKDTQRVNVENLQDIRSLQVAKGSVLGWTVGLAHWGTKQSRLGEPRMSIGYYVQKAEAECLETPPVELSVPFSLPRRLSIVGDQILMYSRSRENELIEFAKTLVELGEQH